MRKDYDFGRLFIINSRYASVFINLFLNSIKICGLIHTIRQQKKLTRSNSLPTLCFSNGYIYIVLICYSFMWYIYSTLEYGINSENLSLSAIRTIRVLRPLRAINRIPSKYRPLYNVLFYTTKAVLT